ncbi:hypothetical protein JCM3770_000834 [Rhodotorula araucariae]
MYRCPLDASIPLLACTTLFLALVRLPTADAFLDTSPPPRHDVAGAALRFKQRKIPHYSHRPPVDKRQNAAQGLLCALGVASACDNASGPATDTSSDLRNCGAVGNVCPSSFAYSAGPVICSAGQCVSGCVLGYSWDSASSSCISTTSDPANCGAVGTVCTTPTGTTAIACVAGTCIAVECAPGFALMGGSCAAVPFAADVNNCGAVGAVCPESFPNGQGSMCEDGRCRPESCDGGYDWDKGLAACIDVRSDPANWCARLTFSNPSKTAGRQGAPSASARVRLKQALLKSSAPATLCPSGLTACPIVPPTVSLGAPPPGTTTPSSSGAASWASLSLSRLLAITGSESGFGPEEDDSRGGGGGYECLDVRVEAESCGGCATTGDGADCTALRGARATGCENGTATFESKEATHSKAARA